MRSALAVAVAALTLLAACGGGGPAREPAPGTPENPLAAVPQEGTAVAAGSEGSAGKAPAPGQRAPKTSAPGGAQKRATTPGAARPPGYDELVRRQSSKPRSSFTPCNLVSEARAQAIVGAPMQAPLEAPQGPTCIYRTRTGDRFVTLGLSPLRGLQPQLKRARSVEVSGRRAYCAGAGLFVPVTRGRVLAVTAPCGLATRFAAAALRRL
jgi:hypothetical protein